MIFELIFMIENFIFKLGCSNSEQSVKMRSKQQAYTHVVKSTWNQTLSLRRRQGYATAGKPYWYARHDVTGSDLHYPPPYYSLAVPYLRVPIHFTSTVDSKNSYSLMMLRTFWCTRIWCTFWFWLFQQPTIESEAAKRFYFRLLSWTDLQFVLCLSIEEPTRPDLKNLSRIQILLCLTLKSEIQPRSQALSSASRTREAEDREPANEVGNLPCAWPWEIWILD